MELAVLEDLGMDETPGWTRRRPIPPVARHAAQPRLFDVLLSGQRDEPADRDTNPGESDGSDSLDDARPAAGSTG